MWGYVGMVRAQDDVGMGTSSGDDADLGLVDQGGGDQIAEDPHVGEGECAWGGGAEVKVPGGERC